MDPTNYPGPTHRTCRTRHRIGTPCPTASVHRDQGHTMNEQTTSTGHYAADCPGSGAWVAGTYEPRGGIGGNPSTEPATCPACQWTDVPVSTPAGHDQGGYLFTHLRAGATLADRGRA